MGLTYSYVLAIRQTDEPMLTNYINQTDSIKESATALDKCITIDFPLDATLNDYLRKIAADYYRSTWVDDQSADSSYHNFFPTDENGRVGCI